MTFKAHHEDFFYVTYNPKKNKDGKAVAISIRVYPKLAFFGGIKAVNVRRSTITVEGVYLTGPDAKATTKSKTITFKVTKGTTIMSKAKKGLSSIKVGDAYEIQHVPARKAGDKPIAISVWAIGGG